MVRGVDPKAGLDAVKITPPPTGNQTPILSRPVCGLVTILTELSRHQIPIAAEAKHHAYIEVWNEQFKYGATSFPPLRDDEGH